MLDSDRAVRSVEREFAYQAERVRTLRSAYDHMRECPMSTFDMVMWYREYQRVLLELRAFINWKDVIAARVADIFFDRPHPVLPLRGVITSNITLVCDMFRCGVPVWWVRPRYTLTTDLVIERLKTQVEPGWIMSTSRIMNHYGMEKETALWIDAPHAQLSRARLHDRLRRFTLTNKPLLEPLKSLSLSLNGDEQRSTQVEGHTSIEHYASAIPNDYEASLVVEDDVMMEDISREPAVVDVEHITMNALGGDYDNECVQSVILWYGTYSQTSFVARAYQIQIPI